MEEKKILVGGSWGPSDSGRYFESEDPYAGRPWCRIPECGASDVDRAVDAAHEAFRDSAWTVMHASDRGRLLHALGAVIADHAEELAELEVRDNGKLMAEMLGQCRYLPRWYEYYGGLADKIEGRVIPVDKPDMMVYTRREPLGVVAALVPWNSPLLLLSWKLAPLLAAGNTAVIKPSEYTSASTLRFAELFEEAGFPPGVINVVTGFGDPVGAALAGHPKVAKVAFTGGGAGGRAVYRAAAEDFKHVTLELGGKSANIVFADAKRDNAVKGVISGIFAATGQTCIAGSRLLVEASIHDEFVEDVVAFARRARFGDPRDPGTQVGPVTTAPQYEKVLAHIESAKAEGAEVVLGGRPGSAPECGNGRFVEPTILTGVTNDMRIAQEEVFGPVLAVIPFQDQDDAIRIANDSRYGLAAGVWTSNMRTAQAMVESLDAGMVWVNTYRSVSYMAPFGGMKESGIGRENGIEAIDEYLQTKCVWVSTQTEVPNPFVMR
ncbi:MAG: aldehyde dehydrogenase [Gemmatimonadetes bacterium]|nr:aldehyde dehydrogenase [Gemmatimonadota bacterium]